jgi:tRNA(Ile)-lysidine synthase
VVSGSLIDALTASQPAPGSRVLVAVSGGVDSMVLLYLLSGIAAKLDLSLGVAHVDHQIRSSSHVDADFVRNACADLGLPFHLRTVNVPKLAAACGASLELAGRNARRTFFCHLREKYGYDRIALAHHQQDQVETFLLRVIRGTGVSGLASMRTIDGFWWRPLLCCSRQQIELYAQAHDVRWREDETNRDVDYLRNLIRLKLVPCMTTVNPQFGPRIENLIEQVQQEEDFWILQVRAAYERVLLDDSDGLRFDRRGLLEIHPALRLRLYRYALAQVRDSLQGLEAIHLHDVDALLRCERSQSQIDLPGVWVARRYECLWLRKQAPQKVSFLTKQLSPPTQLEWLDGLWLKATFIEKSFGETPCAVEFDWDRLEGLLTVRNWKAGDRFVSQGMSGHKRIKRLFGDAKIELEQRSRIPLITCGEEILWVAGVRRSQVAPVTADSRRILRLELQFGP